MSVVLFFISNVMSFFQDTLVGNLLRLINTMRSSPSTSKGTESSISCHGISHFITVGLLLNNFLSLLCVTELKAKNEQDKLKEKYPALCKPDAAAWTVRLI